MNKIEIIPKCKIDFSNVGIPTKEHIELIEAVGGSIGHEDLLFKIYWDEDDNCPLLKAYMVKIYGEEIKNYTEFVLIGY